MAAMVAFNTRFVAAEPAPGGFVVEAAEGRGPDAPRLRIGARILVNAAGLFAGRVAAATAGLDPAHRREIHYCKGNYFAVAGRVPFRHLIYPVPERDGLGVHLTLDLAGQGRFGPDTEWIEGIDYSLDARRAATASTRRSGATGRRSRTARSARPIPASGRSSSPRAARPPTSLIEGPEVHGVPGLVNLFGIESPGLTASLAIAEEVLARLEAA